MAQTPEKALATLESSQEILFLWLDNPQITSTEEQRNGENLLISARFALKQAEKTRKELTQPLDESKSRIMALFRPYTDRLQTGIDTISSQLAKYRAEIVRQQAKLREEALAEQAARIEESLVTGEIVEPISKLDIPIVAKTSRSELGATTYREEWDVQIVNPDLVPRELCEPSMAKIRGLVKSGNTNIPGVLVARKLIPVTRRSW